MKKWRRGLTLALAVLFCLVLAACGGDSGSDNNGGDVAGDDWRTTGVVDGMGTITLDGQEIDVCYCVHDDKTNFYYDDEVQVGYDLVQYPFTLDNARDSFSGCSLDDLDGDGNSDVRLEFEPEDGNDTVFVWYWEGEDGFVFHPEASFYEDPAGAEGDIADYVGLWEYTGENIWLKVYEDSTWEFVNLDDDTLASGVVLVDGYGIELHDDGTGDVLRLDRTVSGDLIDSVNDGTLIPVEGIQSSDPYFSRNGLEINAAVDMGTFLLKDGVCSYSNLGDGYNTDECYWEVIKNSDYTHDGIREIQFDAICYIPDTSIPYFEGDYITNTKSELYDFYTGMWLTAATAYGNSDRGDNYYLHTVSWNGQSYLIEFAYSTDWQYNVNDWAVVLTKSYIVYLPEGYDGLVFAAETQPDNYSDCAKLMQMDSISPEASIMDIDLIDPYQDLFFSICY